nr:immunoglobulin heavy chain junction region [Mus musculus]MBK4185479.1 immunoglobulin heavy chain junction region [Mus musculus]
CAREGHYYGSSFDYW